VARPQFATWLKVQVVAGLASLPWAVGVLLNWSAVQAEASLAGSATEPPAWEFVLPQVWGFHLTGLVNVMDKPGVRPLALILLILLIVLLLWRWLARRQTKASTGTLLLFWLGPLALGFSVWLVRSYSHPRYIALFAAGFVLLLAVLLTPTRMSGRWLLVGECAAGGNGRLLSLAVWLGLAALLLRSGFCQGRFAERGRCRG
jgi:hypothetical protein